MKPTQKEKLVSLGAEALADVLLELAQSSKLAKDLIKQKIMSPKQSVQHFKKKLMALKKSKRFMEWSQTRPFAQELKMLLQSIEKGVSDPLEGLELVAMFYKADGVVFEMCDDSSGIIGEIFKVDAKELFLKYAKLCQNKNEIYKIILNTTQNDGYGVRDSLIECATQCLPNELIQNMISELQHLAKKEKSDYNKRHFLSLVGCLAEQTQDAELFEKACVESFGKLSVHTLLKIAEIHIQNAELNKALERLNQIPEDEVYLQHQRQELMIEIYEKQGKAQELSAVLLQRLQLYPTTEGSVANSRANLISTCNYYTDLILRIL